MIPKFNKETQRWGVWVPSMASWMLNGTKEPLRFQTKQAAQKHIEKIKESV